jgi:hypothetical protein
MIIFCILISVLTIALWVLRPSPHILHHFSSSSVLLFAPSLLLTVLLFNFVKLSIISAKPWAHPPSLEFHDYHKRIKAAFWSKIFYFSVA